MFEGVELMNTTQLPNYVRTIFGVFTTPSLPSQALMTGMDKRYFERLE